MAPVEATDALARLMEGNRRFASGATTHPRQTPERRSEVARGQAPFAAVIGCSDSRVPPEMVFDCGLGDLFVLRSAGHLLDQVGLATVEYAIEHLSLRLVLVLGHSSCGAVAAALHGGYFPGHLADLVAALRPAVLEAQFQPGDWHTNAARANTLRTLRQLRSSTLALASPEVAPHLLIAGAFYDLTTGRVEILRE